MIRILYGRLLQEKSSMKAGFVECMKLLILICNELKDFKRTLDN